MSFFPGSVASSVRPKFMGLVSQPVANVVHIPCVDQYVNAILQQLLGLRRQLYAHAE